MSLFWFCLFFQKRIVAEFEQQQYVENKAAEENQKLKSIKEVINIEIYPFLSFSLSKAYRRTFFLIIDTLLVYEFQSLLL